MKTQQSGVNIDPRQISLSETSRTAEHSLPAEQSGLDTQSVADLQTERDNPAPTRSRPPAAKTEFDRSTTTQRAEDLVDRLVDAEILDQPNQDGRYVDFPNESHVQTGRSRKDPISGSWTIFAPGRARRPDQFKSHRPKPDVSMDCPFCHGNENLTPASVWSAKLSEDEEAVPQSADWTVRVVPNLFPAIKPEGNTELKPTAADDEAETRLSPFAQSLFVEEIASGGHEVIIEAARHTRSLSELNLAEIALAFSAYAARMRHWRQQPGIQFISLFKNVGRDAGASLQHSHSQLIASNHLPHSVREVNKRMRSHFDRYGRCLQCDVLQAELERKERIVHQSDSLVAYCPHASRFPYLIRITSKMHVGCFEDLSVSMNEEVARLVLRSVRWLEAIIPGVAYNMMLHTGPAGDQHDNKTHHWSLELAPRIGRLAGYELSSGGMINTVYPEAAADEFRHQARRSDPRHALR
ncbi:galactose-1-phosphate uridylyltransferase [Rhodopirellula europaea]|uniref:galactose-1-phosphate uridylyltransferase n=1 Tax=Rhodopirellula europaea TaxID=1263866 RepID=UPI003D2A9AE2|tara:strand:- start:1340 stop:2740 length:1401 start_codon:yes stop_codon:yes gene_type:complete